MVSLKHKFVTAKSDGGDVTLVKPSDWNNEHDLVVTNGANTGVVLGRTVGAGSGAVQEVAFDTLTAGITAVPVGTVVAFAGLAAPAGWYLCDASLKSTTTDAALFAVLQYTYGGSGANFAVPDLRGRVVCAPDGGTNRNPTFNAVGVAGGIDQRTASIGGAVIDFADTDWFINDPANGGNRTTTAPDAGSINTSGSGGGSAFEFPNKNHTHIYNMHGVAVEITGSAQVTGGTTSGTFGIIQPTITMNYIIKR